MASRHFSTNFRPFLEFSQWVDETSQEGLTSDNTPAKYIPGWEQRKRWNSSRIREIVESRNLFIHTNVIEKEYTQVFSILVYISGTGLPAIDFLKNIISHARDDATLPWSESHRHDIFSSAEGARVYEKFIDAQWKFCPISASPFMPGGPLMHDRIVDRRQIFPISVDTVRPDDPHRANRRVVLSYKTIHSPPNMQGVGQPTVPTTVVFKTYPPTEGQSYEDEHDTYIVVRNTTKPENILRCLGSFHYLTERRERTSSIMLELADHGTLRDIYKRNNPPYRFEDIAAFWKGFVGAAYGLETIHNLVSSKGYKIVHQDLKPSNLFVFKGNPKLGPFSYKFKIGDFGASNAQSANPAFHGQNGPDKGATREYGPPELHLNDMIDYKVTSAVDMWAFGCIMIETAVWVVGGELARQDFRRARMEETNNLPDHKQLGRSDCFHDGNSVLECVTNLRQQIAENRRIHDSITPAIVDLALDHALIDTHGRMTAAQISHHIKNHINRALLTSPDSVGYIPAPSPSTPPSARSGQPHSPVPRDSRQGSSMSPGEPFPPLPVSKPNHKDVPPSPTYLPNGGSGESSPDIPRASPIDEKPSDLTGVKPPSVTASSFPPVSIGALQDWVKCKKEGNSKNLPGWDTAKPLLNGRDFIILIDNSRHMKQYKKEIKNSVSALTYLFKSLDPDGIQVANTSAPRMNKIVKRSREITAFVDNTFTEGNGADCMIENALDAILNPIKTSWKTSRRSSTLFNSNNLFNLSSSSARGVSILVFTNGLWDHFQDGTSGADRPLQKLIDEMKRLGISRTQVSVQFVRLGNEARGIRRLTILDDELPQRPGNEDFDIVDHKSIDASIWEIVIGSMQEETDRGG